MGVPVFKAEVKSVPSEMSNGSGRIFNCSKEMVCCLTHIWLKGRLVFSQGSIMMKSLDCVRIPAV